MKKDHENNIRGKAEILKREGYQMDDIKLLANLDELRQQLIVLGFGEKFVPGIHLEMEKGTPHIVIPYAELLHSDAVRGVIKVDRSQSGHYFLTQYTTDLIGGYYENKKLHPQTIDVEPFQTESRTSGRILQPFKK